MPHYDDDVNDEVRAISRRGFIQKHGLEMRAEFVPQSKSGGYDGKGEPCINWRVTIARAYADGTLSDIWTGDYTQGIGHLPDSMNLGRLWGRRSVDQDAAIRAACETGRAVPVGRINGPPLVPPDIADVLYSLLMDGMADSQTFEEWCYGYGYDTDSRRAEATYKTCADIGKAFRLALGEEELNRARELWADY